MIQLARCFLESFHIYHTEFRMTRDRNFDPFGLAKMISNQSSFPKNASLLSVNSDSA